MQNFKVLETFPLRLHKLSKNSFGISYSDEKTVIINVSPKNIERNFHDTNIILQAIRAWVLGRNPKREVYSQLIQLIQEKTAFIEQKPGVVKQLNSMQARRSFAFKLESVILVKKKPEESNLLFLKRS